MFSCYFLGFVPVIPLLHFLILFLNGSFKVAKIYENVLGAAVVIFGLALWHKLSRKSIKKDVKQVAGFIFLRFVGFFRTIRSANEAGNVSRILIFAPYTIGRWFLVLLRGLTREIRLGFNQFLYTVGLKKLR